MCLKLSNNFVNPTKTDLFVNSTKKFCNNKLFCKLNKTILPSGLVTLANEFGQINKN